MWVLLNSFSQLLKIATGTRPFQGLSMGLWLAWLPSACHLLAVQSQEGDLSELSLGFSFLCCPHCALGPCYA